MAIKNYNASFEDKPEYYDQLRAGHILVKRLNLIKNYIKSEDLKILEIGCGTGKLISELSNLCPDKIFFGADAVENYINYAKNKYSKKNLNFEVLDLENNSLPEEHDFVYSIDLLHHLNNLEESVSNISKMLNDDGRWLIMEPSPYNLYVRGQQFIKTGEKNFQNKLFLKLAADYNLELIEKRHYLLLPAAIREPSEKIKKIEKKLEANKFLGTSLVYILQKNGKK